MPSKRVYRCAGLLSVVIVAANTGRADAALVARYTFEEPTGDTVLDSVPAGGLNNGTLTNGATRSTAAPLAGLSSLSLAAGTNNDFVAIGTPAAPLAPILSGATSITISARINTTVASTTSGVQDILWIGRDNSVAGSNPSQVRISFGLNNDSLRIGGRTAAEGSLFFQTPAGAILPNTTYDVTGTLDVAGKSATITVTPVSTGVAASFTSLTATPNPFAGFTNTFFPVNEVSQYAGIGARPNNNAASPAVPEVDEEFSGQIDNLTIDVVPEPGSVGLAGVAAAGLLARRRRRRTA